MLTEQGSTQKDVFCSQRDCWRLCAAIIELFVQNSSIDLIVS